MSTNKKFENLYDQIVSKIKWMLQNEQTITNEGVDREDLEYMLREIKNMNNLIMTNNLPPKRQRYPILARIIVDQWPLDTELGNQIIELEEIYKNL